MIDVVPAFARRFYDPVTPFTGIGSGALGGKAQGLVRARRILRERPELSLPGFRLNIPALTVVATDHFESFLDRNRLKERLTGSDDQLAEAFQKSDLPAEIVGDIRAIAQEVRVPLAVRSSSLLEDALGHPFAGVYATKMLPGNQKETDSRFRRLSEAIKLVYASTFFKGARTYRHAVGAAESDERMAVILQEVVGRGHGGRFYPDISGVARSLNVYPFGAARPEDGVASLAVGLGKTIVDGDVCWSFSPAHPRVGPPHASAAERLRGTQMRLWAVNVGAPPAYDPIREAEYLVQVGLQEAEMDGTLSMTASTYDAGNDRITPGTGRLGARVVDFAPLLVLEELALAAQIRSLLAACEQDLSAPVEIEFAVTLPGRGAPPRFGLLQVRLLAGPGDVVSVTEEDLSGERLLASSENALGNGVIPGIRDVVFLDPDRFDTRETRTIVREIEQLNARLVSQGKDYLLIGFGRWGSADPALGIPVTWPQIAGAKGIVEAGIPGYRIEPSQGSHFFHNLANLGVCYLSVSGPGEQSVDWRWLRAQRLVEETGHARHVETHEPLTLRIDGRSRRGVILRGEA